MSDERKTDSLGPGDVRWLQGEFAATRGLISTNDLSIRTLVTSVEASIAGRLDEHHQRIASLENAEKETPSKKWVGAVLTVATTITGVIAYLSAR